MQNVAAHAARGAYREGYQMGVQPPGRAGGNIMNVCPFAAAPEPRCYCSPAAFSSIDGRNHHSLLAAYGNSRPCSQLGN